MSATKRLLLVALVAGSELLASGGSAVAQSLGDMARTGATDLRGFENLIEIGLYIGGVVMIIVGLVKLKRYNDSSRDQRLGGAVMSMSWGLAHCVAGALWRVR